MNIYDVNFNFYGSISIEANTEDEAREEFYKLEDKAILNHIADNMSSIETGTIELYSKED